MVACLLPELALDSVWQQSMYLTVKAVMAGGLCGGVPGPGQGPVDQPQRGRHDQDACHRHP